MNVEILKMTYDSEFGYLSPQQNVIVDEQKAKRWEKHKIAKITETKVKSKYKKSQESERSDE